METVDEESGLDGVVLGNAAGRQFGEGTFHGRTATHGINSVCGPVKDTSRSA
jgi:hypothetical protein